MMHPQLFEELLDKYLRDKIRPDELPLLLAAAREERFQNLIKEALLHKLQYPDLYKLADENKLQQLFDQMLVKAAIPDAPSVHPLQTRRLRYAAAILMLLLGGGFLWKMLENNSVKTKKEIAEKTEDIAPGKNGAILTLADGRRVVLDSVTNGIIADKNGTHIQLNSGLLCYRLQDRRLSANEGRDGSPVAYNSLATPKGRQFQLILPDGSKVWLNAASSIRYPTVFNGKERKVEITGEVYLEIAKDKSRPFFVETNNARIDVLGTSFNVNAYEDEPSIKTTLINGSVRIQRKGFGQLAAGTSNEAILKPGQQASLTNNQLSIIEDQGEAALAWKNGYFNFDNASLQQVMHQLERWYDIDVTYEKGIPDIHFLGEMSRNLQLADLLKALELSKVHFKVMEGRKLLVLP